MIATVFVSNMDNAIRFYTEALGLKLQDRFGDYWATIDAGNGLIGLHPASKQSPAGQKGSITLGFQTSDIEQTVSQLGEKGVQCGPIVAEGTIRAAHFGDVDGNALYFVEVRSDYKDPSRTS